MHGIFALPELDDLHAFLSNSDIVVYVEKSRHSIVRSQARVMSARVLGMNHGGHQNQAKQRFHES